ncbi:UNVERIFIED_CONTAM: hypothetical protein GTU68_034224 [Idotea baltica]|nr:hypothetical protein [Idotea baltica]
MNTKRLNGLVAATYTPLNADGSINASAIAPLVDHLLQQGVQGLYVCGSTGEGMSLSTNERKLVAEQYVKATAGRVPVIVQVGHNSLTEAAGLAAHAQQIGADIVSATCPSYFKVSNVDTLIACMAEIASAAPDLPFYYYHIPALTGSAIDMIQFLSHAENRIPNLVGLKYTDTKLFEFQECQELSSGRFDVVWGCDEMLLGALATGAQAAIGSTYNIAAPLYSDLMTAFNNGDLAAAKQLQSKSVKMIRTLGEFPFHPAMKAVLGILGFEMGDCRLPQGGLSEDEKRRLKSRLDDISFFDDQA